MGKHYSAGFLQSDEPPRPRDPYRQIGVSVLLAAWRDLHSVDSWHIPLRDRYQAGCFLFERDDAIVRHWFLQAGVHLESFRMSRTSDMVRARRIFLGLRHALMQPDGDTSIRRLHARLRTEGKVH